MLALVHFFPSKITWRSVLVFALLGVCSREWAMRKVHTLSRVRRVVYGLENGREEALME